MPELYSKIQYTRELYKSKHTRNVYEKLFGVKASL